MYPYLIASDLDGTLITEEKPQVDPRLFSLIRRLREKGILFCVASGRSYASLCHLFQSVRDEILFLAENGAELYRGEHLLMRLSMPRDSCRELVEKLLVRGDCYPKVNTSEGNYIFAPDGNTLQRLREIEDPTAIGVQNFDQIQGEITQVTAISFGDIGPIAWELLPQWEKRLHGIVSGEHWLDFTAAGKEVGLQALSKQFRIPRDRVMAFGDNYNDAAMLEWAGEGYLMDSAPVELQRRFPLQVSNVTDFLLELEPHIPFGPPPGVVYPI